MVFGEKKLSYSSFFRYMMNPRQSPPVAVTNPNPLSLPISPKTPGLMSVNVNHSVAEEEQEQVMETDLVFIKANDELHLTKVYLNL